MTTTTTTATFQPAIAAHYAAARFRSRAAGKTPQTEADIAASLILWTRLDATQNALMDHYAGQVDAMNWNILPARNYDHQMLIDGGVQAACITHGALLRVLMVALLTPQGYSPNKLAPIDFAGLADIALANHRYSDR